MQDCMDSTSFSAFYSIFFSALTMKSFINKISFQVKYYLKICILELEGRRKEFEEFFSTEGNVTWDILNRRCFQVFISKKRTPRQQKLSEFKGGDLNKYTARSYAIQNGNEIFGGKCTIADFFQDCVQSNRFHCQND